MGRRVVSGENWHEGPQWVKHRFRSIEYDRNATEDLHAYVVPHHIWPGEISNQGEYSSNDKHC
jgi:hypothetical protein